jgi:hypothetical protein
MKKLIEENSQDITIKPSVKYPELSVIKYKHNVFYKDTWNDFLRECRGMIVDQDFNIISLPFTKIHNYKIESSAPKFDPDEMVNCSKKVNGFMIAVTCYNGDLLWSTTGSLDSNFVSMAKDEFYKFKKSSIDKFIELIKTYKNETFMFECVHPNDPHIVYEEPGLYFLGSREKKLYSELSFSHINEMIMVGSVFTPKRFTTTVSFLEQLNTKCKHEGYVFSSLDNKRVSKIKSPHYLTKKFLMRGNWLKFINSKIDVPEEFIDLCNWIREVEGDNFFNLDELARREFIEEFFLGIK